MIQTGTAVKVTGACPQEWGWDRESRQEEKALLDRYIGKVGVVWHVDGCEEMPFLVRFRDDAGVPLSSFRFGFDELEEAG